MVEASFRSDGMFGPTNLLHHPAVPVDACGSGSSRHQPCVLLLKSVEVVTVGSEADMSVRPNDQKREFPDVHLVGYGWCEPCVSVLTIGSSRDHKRRFDDGNFAPHLHRSVERWHTVRVHRRSADKQRGVTGTYNENVRIRNHMKATQC